MLETQVKAYDKELRLPGGLASMGKTVEYFRIALEGEISRWRDFARALLSLVWKLLAKNLIYLIGLSHRC
jgi:hypothetical protein